AECAERVQALDVLAEHGRILKAVDQRDTLAASRPVDIGCARELEQGLRMSCHFAIPERDAADRLLVVACVAAYAADGQMNCAEPGGAKVGDVLRIKRGTFVSG